jgi:hypothetical protein
VPCVRAIRLGMCRPVSHGALMIVLRANVECNSCLETYDGHWDDIADSVQDLDEAPVQEQECPGCGNKQWEQWPGWTSYTEAG